MAKSKSIWDRIEERRAERNVLEHPFYIRWSNGELTADELATYSGQYRHATEAIAKLCSDAATHAPESDRDKLRRHAAEEHAHISLWDGFVEAAGGEIGAEPKPETAACVQEWTAFDGYLPALARLYAIESGQPEISRTKLEGLDAHYGVPRGGGTEYFTVHERMDHHHAAEVRSLIEREMTDADADAIVDAAAAAFDANWRLLDGVA